MFYYDDYEVLENEDLGYNAVDDEIATKEKWENDMMDMWRERELEEREKPKMYKVIKNITQLKKDIIDLGNRLEGQDKKDLLDFYERFEKLEKEVKK